MADKGAGVESVQKTLRLLELLAKHNGELSVTQIAEQLDCSVSSANRFLQTMQREGYVRKNVKTNRYELTYRLFSLSSHMVDHDDMIRNLIELAHKISQKYDVSVNINAVSGKDAMLLFRVTRYYNKDLDFIGGKTAPAYCTSSGKAILSQYSEEQLDEYFRDLSLTAFQKKPLSEESLREELALARKNGYAVCSEEYVSGVFSFSLPVKDKNGRLYAFTVITGIRDQKRVFCREVIQEIRECLDKY